MENAKRRRPSPARNAAPHRVQAPAPSCVNGEGSPLEQAGRHCRSQRIAAGAAL